MSDQDTTTRNNTIVDLYVNNELTMKEIGEKFDISRQRVQQILKNKGVYGLPSRINKDRRKEFEWAEWTILEHYTNTTLSAQEIANKEGIPPTMVKDVFLKHKIDRSGIVGKRAKELYESIYKYAKENPEISYAKISVLYDTSVTTVIRALRRHNYYRKKSE